VTIFAVPKSTSKNVSDAAFNKYSKYATNSGNRITVRVPLSGINDGAQKKEGGRDLS
jgi:hypothetical protein